MFTWLVKKKKLGSVPIFLSCKTRASFKVAFHFFPLFRNRFWDPHNSQDRLGDYLMETTSIFHWLRKSRFISHFPWLLESLQSRALPVTMGVQRREVSKVHTGSYSFYQKWHKLLLLIFQWLKEVIWPHLIPRRQNSTILPFVQRKNKKLMKNIHG